MCLGQFQSGVTGTPMNGTLSLTDAGGHTSNALAFNTTIPERRRGRWARTAPPPP